MVVVRTKLRTTRTKKHPVTKTQTRNKSCQRDRKNSIPTLHQARAQTKLHPVTKTQTRNQSCQRRKISMPTLHMHMALLRLILTKHRHKRNQSNAEDGQCYGIWAVVSKQLLCDLWQVEILGNRAGAERISMFHTVEIRSDELVVIIHRAL